MRTAAGVLLVAAAATTWAAAATPQLARGWMLPLAERLEIVARHRRAWLLANLGFAAGAALGAVAVPLAAPSLDGAATAVGSAFFAAGSLLWLALTLRRTWTPERTLPAAVFPTAIALINVGLIVATAPLLPSWRGWLGVTLGAAELAMLAVLRDVPPFAFYITPFALGVSLL